jgi:Co/Zn/Cd efflux system component
MISHANNIFAACCPGSSGLTANCILMVVLCATEVGASMSIGSLLLLADFYRRLSCVFLLIQDMESEQLKEDYAGSNVNVLAVGQRGSNLSKAFVGIYLLSASFFMATASLWRMYGHNPPEMDDSGYLVFLGALGLALDVLHVFCGVRQTIVHEDTSLSRHWWCIAQVYGSVFVMLEGLIDTANPGKYLDPIMTIFFVAVMCMCNVSATLSASSELYNRGRG